MIRELTPMTAKAGQARFEIAGGYIPGSLILNLNGTPLLPEAIIATDGNTVQILAPLQDGDQISASAWGR